MIHEPISFEDLPHRTSIESEEDGPKTEPWGTPKCRVTGSDLTEPTLTIWDLPVRYDLINVRAHPEMPNMLVSLLMRIW